MLASSGTTPLLSGDVALMGAAGRGDASARDAVARRLLPRVRRLARALAAGSPDWEDAAQQVLLEVVRSAGTYDGSAAVERWCDRVTVRVTIRLLKRERERKRPVDPEQGVDELAGAHVPEGDFSTSELDRMMRRLSEPKRVALVLHHVGGYSVDEVAALTEVSVNTAKDRLLAGRREMRAMVRRAETGHLRLVGDAR